MGSIINLVELSVSTRPWSRSSLLEKHPLTFRTPRHHSALDPGPFGSVRRHQASPSDDIYSTKEKNGWKKSQRKYNYVASSASRLAADSDEISRAPHTRWSDRPTAAEADDPSSITRRRWRHNYSFGDDRAREMEMRAARGVNRTGRPAGSSETFPKCVLRVFRRELIVIPDCRPSMLFRKAFLGWISNFFFFRNS